MVNGPVRTRQTVSECLADLFSAPAFRIWAFVAHSLFPFENTVRNLLVFPSLQTYTFCDCLIRYLAVLPERKETEGLELFGKGLAGVAGLIL